MNKEIQQRTKNKLKQNSQIGLHTWQLTVTKKAHNQQKNQQMKLCRNYIVYENVFSPAIFLGTEWLTNLILDIVEKQISNKAQGDKKDFSALQIGCGCGVTSIQLALNIKDIKVSASDINPSAVACTIQNSQKHGCCIKTYISNIYQNVPCQKFDIVYWNYPFHPTQKQIGSMSVLQRAVRDPQYQSLQIFLKETPKFLVQGGRVFLGFSLVMGDYERLIKMAKKYCYQIQIVDKMRNDGIICLVQLKNNVNL